MELTNIRERCKEKELSIAQLEKAAGIANGVIARWEKSSPRVDNLLKVAGVLGCSVDDLLKEG